MRRLALALCLAASTAGAEDWSDLAALHARVFTAPMLSEADWRAMVEGKTVTYTIADQFFAREFYETGTNRVVISVAGGLCLEGQWYMDGPAFCFIWEGNPPSCFSHHQTAEGVFITALNNPDGIEVQQVADVRRATVQCGEELLSSLPQSRGAL